MYVHPIERQFVSMGDLIEIAARYAHSFHQAEICHQRSVSIALLSRGVKLFKLPPGCVGGSNSNIPVPQATINPIIVNINIWLKHRMVVSGHDYALFAASEWI